jgi:hypothetical protein
MPKFRVRVWDEVTYARTTEIEVEADTEEDACDKAIEAAELRAEWTETQTDAQPYEAEVISA